MEVTITDLVKYMERLDPSVRDKMIGADDDEIDELEQLALDGALLYLPYDYREFLYYMGNQEPIPFAFDAKMNLPAVKETYRDFLNSNVYPPPNHIWIAADGYDVPQVALECQADEHYESQIIGVATTDGDHKEFHINDGFTTFLFRRVFELTECHRNPVMGAFHSKVSTPILQPMAEALMQAGWENRWFSDSVTLSMTSADERVFLMVRQRAGEQAILKIHGRNKKEIWAAALIINSAVQLLTHGWFKV